MPSCVFCNHRDRSGIEKAVATKKLSMTAAAKRIGCDKASVSRHMKTHVSDKIAKAAEANDLQEGLNVINALTESRARLLSIYDEARASGDLRSAIASLQTEVSQLSLMGKITGQFSDQSQVNVLMASAEDERIMAVIYRVLEPYPDIRVTLSEALDAMDSDD